MLVNFQFLKRSIVSSISALELENGELQLSIVKLVTSVNSLAIQDSLLSTGRFGLLKPFEVLPCNVALWVAPNIGKRRRTSLLIISSADWFFRFCSILVLRQTLAESLVTSPSDMEDIVAKSVKRSFELLDNVEDAGITEVVETMDLCLEGDEPEKRQARKEIMVNVLAKSLRAGDAIFTRVSRTVLVAARAIILGRSGAEGRRLAENTLKRVGATILTGKLVDAIENLLVVATVSASVHGSRYQELIKNMRAL